MSTITVTKHQEPILKDACDLEYGAIIGADQKRSALALERNGLVTTLQVGLAYVVRPTPAGMVCRRRL